MTIKHSHRLFGLLVLLLGLCSATWGADATPVIKAAPGPVIKEAPAENNGSLFDVVTDFGKEQLQDAALDAVGDIADSTADILTDAADQFEKTAKMNLENAASWEKVRIGETDASSGARRLSPGIKQTFKKQAEIAGRKAIWAKTGAVIAKGIGVLARVPGILDIISGVANCGSALESGNREAFVEAFKKSTKEVASILLTEVLSGVVDTAIAAIPGIGPVAAVVLGTIVHVGIGMAVDWVLNKMDSQFTALANMAWNAFYKDKSVAALAVPDTGGGGSSQKMKKLDIGITK